MSTIGLILALWILSSIVAALGVGAMLDRLGDGDDDE
jgi:hypothetical protein